MNMQARVIRIIVRTVMLNALSLYILIFKVKSPPSNNRKKGVTSSRLIACLKISSDKRSRNAKLGYFCSLMFRHCAKSSIAQQDLIAALLDSNKS